MWLARTIFGNSEMHPDPQPWCPRRAGSADACQLAHDAFGKSAASLPAASGLRSTSRVAGCCRGSCAYSACRRTPAMPCMGSAGSTPSTGPPTARLSALAEIGQLVDHPRLSCRRDSSSKQLDRRTDRHRHRRPGGAYPRHPARRHRYHSTGPESYGARCCRFVCNPWLALVEAGQPSTSVTVAASEIWATALRTDALSRGLLCIGVNLL